MSAYRVFADAKGFFGEETLGWGERRPEAILTFEVDQNRRVQDLETVEGVLPAAIRIKDAKTALQSWL